MGSGAFEPRRRGATQAELTGTGAVLGTVDYMGPRAELWITTHADHAGGHLQPRLHAALLADLASRSTRAETMTAKLLAHHRKPIPPLRKMPKRSTRGDQRIFSARWWPRQLEDRYQSMTEVTVPHWKQSALSPSGSISRQQSISTMPITMRVPFSAMPALHGTEARSWPRDQGNGEGNRKLVLSAGGRCGNTKGLAILAGVMFKLKTKDGTLVIEVDQPDSVVEVSNEDTARSRSLVLAQAGRSSRFPIGFRRTSAQG